MSILGTIESIFRLVVGLIILGWFAWGLYFSYSMRAAEYELSEVEATEREPTFAPEPRQYGDYDSYGSSDPYTAPTDDTRPTADDWGY